MSLLPWLRQLSHRLSSRRPRQTSTCRRVRPCLEVLEDRTLPSVSSLGDAAASIAGQGASDPQPSSLQLSNVAITPNPHGININPLDWTARVALTVQVHNPAGVVNEGVVSADVLGISAQGNVVNGKASMQFVIPLLDLNDSQNVRLSYSDDAASAAFGPGRAVTLLPLNQHNAISASDLTFSSGGDETNTIQYGLTPLNYVYVNHQWKELRYGSLDIQVQYTNIDGNVLITLDGVPWQLMLFNPHGQYVGAATVEQGDCGPLVWLSNNQGELVGFAPS